MKPQGAQYKDKALLVWEGRGRWPAVKGVYSLNLEGKKGSIMEVPVDTWLLLYFFIGS